jgi:phytoene/squalene synthetase
MMSSGSTSNSRANDGVLGYMVDSLFRSDQPPADTGGNADSAARLEAGRILANGIRLNSLPAEDRQYLAQVIAKRTGLPPSDAEKRVSDVFNRAHTAIANAAQSAKQTADSARKAAAYSALWIFVALLSGAFVASLAATFGGRQRDRVIHTGSSST